MPDCTALSASYTTARCRHDREARPARSGASERVGSRGGWLAGGKGEGRGGVGVGEEKQPLSKVPKLHGAS